jgi:hypothetical protein
MVVGLTPSPSINDRLLNNHLLDKIRGRAVGERQQQELALISRLIGLSQQDDFRRLFDLKSIDDLDDQEKFNLTNQLLEKNGKVFGNISGPVDQLLKRNTVGRDDFHQAFMGGAQAFASESSLANFHRTLDRFPEKKDSLIQRVGLCYLLLHCIEIFSRTNPQLLDEKPAPSSSNLSGLLFILIGIGVLIGIFFQPDFNPTSAPGTLLAMAMVASVEGEGKKPTQRKRRKLPKRVSALVIEGVDDFLQKILNYNLLRSFDRAHVNIFKQLTKEFHLTEDYLSQEIEKVLAGIRSQRIKFVKSKEREEYHRILIRLLYNADQIKDEPPSTVTSESFAERLHHRLHRDLSREAFKHPNLRLSALARKLGLVGERFQLAQTVIQALLVEFIVHHEDSDASEDFIKLASESS